jgi:hypothetical protein
MPRSLSIRVCAAVFRGVQLLVLVEAFARLARAHDHAGGHSGRSCLTLAEGPHAPSASAQTAVVQEDKSRKSVASAPTVTH